MTVAELPVETTENEFFARRYVGSERADMVKRFGEVPPGTDFIPSIATVLSWGNPMWQVYEEAYKRNSKIGNGLSIDDDLWMWKCLHVMLVRKALNMVVPSFLGNESTRYRWREDFFASASSWLWEIIRSCSDQPLSPSKAVHYTMIKTQTWMITHQTKDASQTAYLADIVTEIASRRAGREASVFDDVSSRLDHKTIEDKLDNMVVDAISRRFPESLYPGSTVVAKKVVSGSRISYKYRWILDFATVYRRYLRGVLRDKERKH